MKINGKTYKTIWFESNVVKIIDQTKLPHKFVIKNLKSVKDAILFVIAIITCIAGIIFWVQTASDEKIERIGRKPQDITLEE